MKTTRRQFLQAAGAGLTASALSARADQKKPNILFILVDQHRGMDLHCMGNDDLLTPNLDQLAGEGILFKDAIANAPLCTPSRATLLTGKYPIAHRCISNDLPLPTDQETIATVLSRSGYKTGYIGKWHLDGISRHKFTPPGPRRHGFNDYWAVYNCHHNYFKTKYYLDTPELIERNGYEPDVQTDLAIEFLREHRSNPFYLTVSYGPPHAPYELVPENYKVFYDPEKIPIRPNSKNPNRKAVSGYYAHITALDVCVGKLLRTLDELNLRENTIVVFTSDHGDMLWSHGRIKKQQPWEESINVPLIIRHPTQIKSNQQSDLLIGTADLAPTLLSFTGSKIPEEMQGLDLSGQILEGKGPKHESIFLVDMLTCDQARQWNGRPWRGVRTDQYTYARFYDEGWVLYDNQKDPLQMDNLYDNPKHAALQKRMEQELQKWLIQLKDEFLSENELLEKLNLAQAWKERNEHFQSGKNW
ncbi:MAG: sulfatase [Candidatus Omnitrophica bacterium]|nr:sulfatase [Candidatus Omnitrophota bacterium]